MTALARAQHRLAHALDLHDEAGWWTRRARERDRRRAKHEAHRARRRLDRAVIEEGREP